MTALEKTDWAFRVGRLLNMPAQEAVSHLTHRTLDGLSIPPLHIKDHLPTDLYELPIKKTSWLATHLCSTMDIMDANKELRRAISWGADALYLIFRGWDPEEGDGICAYSLNDMEILFADVDLSQIPLFIRPGTRSLEIACLIQAYCGKYGIEMCKATDYGVSVFDSLCYFSFSSDLRSSFAGAYDRLGNNISIDMARFMHESGASEAQELAIGLGLGRDYLDFAYESRGVSDRKMKDFVFHFAVDSDFFMNIAKLRAARLLWSLLLEHCGCDGASMILVSHIGRRGLSSYHVELNLARISHGIFSSAVGGADAIVAPSYDGIDSMGSLNGHRMSINAHHILRDEAFADRNSDPAFGSYYIERLTHDLAEKAWIIFTEHFGKPGSVVKKFRQFCSMVKETASARQHHSAYGHTPIVGISAFANIRDGVSLEESSSAKEEPSSSNAYASVSERTPPADGNSSSIEEIMSDSPPAKQFDILSRLSLEYSSLAPRLSFDNRPAPILPSLILNPYRDDEYFSDLRRRADLYYRTYGRFPHIFSGYLGKTQEFLSHYHWLRQFFASGGIDVPFHEGFSDRQSLLSAFDEDGSTLVVLYSGSAFVDEIAKDLKSSIVEQIWLYSAQKQDIPPMTDRILYPGCDMISALLAAHKQIGWNK